MVHGESGVCDSFVECLMAEHGIKAYAPYSGTVFDLVSGKLEYEALPIAIHNKKAPVQNTVYARLLAAAQRLLALVQKSDGLANKDMGKFADQINSLCDKWQ